MNKGYKYKLKPNKTQRELLKSHMFSVSQAYNILLSLDKNEYQENLHRKQLNEKPIYLTSTEKDNKIKEILRNRGLIFNTKLVQQERVRFIQNKKNSIKKFKNGTGTGELKYKKYSHSAYQSFQTTKEQYSIKNSNNPKYKILRLFNQNIKIIWSRELPNHSTITVSFDGLDFFIVFNTQTIDIPINKSISDNKLGIDINNNSIDLGTEFIHKIIKIQDLKDKEKLENKIKKFQKKQSKRLEKSKKEKIKLSKNFHKTQKKINKIHKIIQNKRIYRLHEITKNIIDFAKENKFNHLVVEELDVKEMTKKTTKENKNELLGVKKTKSMKKRILDISYSNLINILNYKCVQNGIKFSKVSANYTSKTCSCCRTINELQLNDRSWTCVSCNTLHNRDQNACINILKRAI